VYILTSESNKLFIPPLAGLDHPPPPHPHPFCVHTHTHTKTSSCPSSKYSLADRRGTSEGQVQLTPFSKTSYFPLSLSQKKPQLLFCLDSINVAQYLFTPRHQIIMYLYLSAKADMKRLGGNSGHPATLSHWLITQGWGGGVILNQGLHRKGPNAR